MSEHIIGVITNVEDDVYNNVPFKKVTLNTGQVLKVKGGREGFLKAKWGLLQVNTTLKFIMQDYTNPNGVKFPFVSDIVPVASILPPPQEPKILPKHEDEIERAKEIVTPHISSPEIGLAYKEIGELYRAGLLDEQKPVDHKLIAKYKNWIMKTLGIEVEYK